MVSTPARLHVILARDTNRAVIIRRGPSKWVRLILWHTDSDTFEGGQWLCGRIYGERCALSPDGKLFLYFATQWHKAGNGYMGSWSAISKPPYLTALALWPEGSTWCGGGLFIDNETVYLSACRGTLGAHPDHQPPKKLRVIMRPADMTGRDQRRLEQIRASDWQLIYESPLAYNAYMNWLDDPSVWQRQHPTQDRYTLIRRYRGYFPNYYPGPSIYEYALADQTSGRETPIEGANWADWDQQGRLVYARDGQIFAQAPDQIGRFARPLADFNDQVFEEIPTPLSASRW